MAIESLVNFYPCLDIEQTTDFYVNKIGLVLSVDQGTARIFDSGYGYLGFCQYEDKQLATNSCLSFNVESVEEVDACFNKFKSMGVTVLAEPVMHNQFAVYSFFISDPNGYKIEFQKILK